MKEKYYILNSFTDDINGGNSAGLVLNQDMSEQEMLNIAKEVGFSETAFLKKINNTTYSLRYFTPIAEVDLCGHATIAAFSFLKQKELINNGEYKLHTKAGIIKIFINDKVFMTQNLPIYSEIVETKEILDCFYNLSVDKLNIKSPIQVVSTGLRDIMVPVNGLKNLLELNPNFEKISKLSEKYNTIGIHAFSTETLNNSSAHCRNFAPLYEIPEESATGTSNGALSCYLYKYNKYFYNCDDAFFSDLTFEQGYCMKKPSTIYVNLAITDKEITEVKVGGNAMLINEKKL